MVPLPCLGFCYLIPILVLFCLPIFWFLGRVCKIQWADRAFVWSVIKVETLKFWKKKEKEKSACTCEGCEKEEK